MPYKIDYAQVTGIKVFLEQRSKRLFVGTLERKKEAYLFSYDEKYLSYKKAIPLGQEFPLTRQYFESQKMFSSFQERIPSKENPAYPVYCQEFGISPEEENPLVLLATIGRRGPSSFVFEPMWGDTFSGKDLKRFREKFGLSTRDFGLSFGIPQATIVRIENGKASGTEILKFLEILYYSPEAASYYIEKYGSALHSRIRSRLLFMLLFRNWHILSQEELEFSQKAGGELKKAPWALGMLNQKPIAQALAYSPPHPPQNEQSIKRTLFEIRFAYAIYQGGLQAEYEFKAGVGDSSVDFRVYGQHKKGKPEWLIELTSLAQSAAVEEHTAVQGNWAEFSSQSTPGDEEKNAPEVRDIIKAQNAILSKVATVDKKGSKSPSRWEATPTKFPEITSTKHHVIIIDMRGFLTGVSDWGDYWNILYGSANLPDEYKRWWINPRNKKSKELIRGIFDPEYPNLRCRYLQERIHAVGFVNEKKFTDGELTRTLTLYGNPLFFARQEDVRHLWPL
jgi:HipA-like protein